MPARGGSQCFRQSCHFKTPSQALLLIALAEKDPQVVDSARALTGSRYGAITVLDKVGRELFFR